MSQPFSRRAVAWIVVVSGISLAAALIFVIFGREVTPISSHEADAYSRSALGHRAFVELLERLGVPVLVSRYDSDARAGTSSLLVVAEPDPWRVDDLDGRLGLALRFRRGPTLLVLPKRLGSRSPTNPDWVDDSGLIDLDDVERVLRLGGVHREVLRTTGRPAPIEWDVREPSLAGPPRIANPQLVEPPPYEGPGVTGARWRSLLVHREGVLVAETRSAYDAPIVIVSDPDIFATHGLDDAGNAALAVSIVEYLREDDAPVVFDETAHGHQLKPTIWRQLFDFPLALAVGHGLLLLAFVLWLAARRFGAPERPPPAIEPGKGFLIANTAELLRYGGHSGHALRRYWFNVLQDVGHTLNAPAHLNSQELRDWLSGVARRRGVRPDPETLARDVDALSSATGKRQARAVVRAARRIHTWRQEMTDGPSDHSSPQ